MRGRIVKIKTYEDGLNWKHNGCGSDAYPITNHRDVPVMWECLDHGLIERSQVERE